MDCKCHKGGGFLFGAFLIVFTFIDWSIAKWITFGIGILMVLHAIAQKSYYRDSCKVEAPVIKKVVKKKTAKEKK